MGAFIKAEQEGKICNGRRLVCMCTHRHHHEHGGDAPLTFKRPGGRGEPGLSSPGFGGLMDKVPPVTVDHLILAGVFSEPATHRYPHHHPQIPEPVPKRAWRPFRVSISPI